MSRQAGKDEARLSGGGADGEGGDPLAAARARERRVKYYTLMVYEDADATLLRLFECFMESAPQLVLQVGGWYSVAPKGMFGSTLPLAWG